MNLSKILPVFALALLLYGTPVYAESVSFDPATPQGRQQAYQALNEANMVGNAQRLLRSLKSAQRGSDMQLKAQAEKLIPALNSLLQSLGQPQ